MPRKLWDQEPEPNDMARRIAARAEARKADMHSVLSEIEQYASAHEALQRVASLLVEAVDDFLDKALEDQEKEGHSSEEEIFAMEEERAHHLEHLTTILVREAVKSQMKKRPE